MKAKKSDYNIEFKGFSDGKHRFDYKIDDSFFRLIEDPLYEKGDINLIVEMTKSSQMLIFDLNFEGSIETFCDNCLEAMRQPISYEYQLIVRLGDDYEEVDDNITIIPREDFKFNIFNVVYDCIVTSQPIRHLHPDDENGKSTCNPDMIEELGNYLVSESTSTTDEESDEIDPRWSELKKLLDNNN